MQDFKPPQCFLDRKGAREWGELHPLRESDLKICRIYANDDEFQQMSLPETPLLQLSQTLLTPHKINHALKKLWDWNHFQISLPRSFLHNSLPRCRSFHRADLVVQVELGGGDF